MKNFFAIAFLLGATVTGFAQGTVKFSNDSSDLASPPDRFVRYDATAASLNPAYTTGARVFSNGAPGLRVQLYFGASTANASSLTAVSTAPSTFKNSTSASVGSWFGGARTLDGFTNGTVNLQVRVWDISLASSFEEATALGGAYAGLIGCSQVFAYTIPTDPLSPLSDFNMYNFQSFSLGNFSCIPEPSTVALLLVGSGVFFVSAKRRRHRKLDKNFFAIAFLLGATVTAFAQGTVKFSNDSTDLASPPDRLVRFNFLSNPPFTDNRVYSNGNPGLRAQLYFGASTANASSLTAVSAAPTTFKGSTSANVGTWFGGGRVLDGFTNGTVNLQVRVWDISLASSFEAATAFGGAYTGLLGTSLIFQYTIPTDPLAPLSAFNMNNFQGFTLGIPEPSTVALLLVGGTLFVLFKSRHRSRD